MDAAPPPTPGTVEAWCLELIETTDAVTKLTPPAPPTRWESAPRVRRPSGPGRPAAWEVVAKAPRSVRKGALSDPARRAELVHTFAHHELQAAELMAWALLAFPEAPPAMRRGLLAIAGEELRHLGLYLDYLASIGHRFGDFPIRDWFWSRVPSAPTPLAFVATMGIGFEGGNLDHCRRYEEWFQAAGDQGAVAILETVREDEIGHVAFAAHWFRELSGGLEFSAWTRSLPPPLSPLLMRGHVLNTRDRGRAGLDPRFLEELSAWSPDSPGS